MNTVDMGNRPLNRQYGWPLGNKFKLEPPCVLRDMYLTVKMLFHGHPSADLGIQNLIQLPVVRDRKIITDGTLRLKT